METTAMLECIRQLQLTLKEHVLLNSKQAEYQMTQNADLFSEMIKGHTRRDLDPAMLAIPTFTGEEPEKCLDWINRIKNVCNQAGRSLRQELMNKSEPVVQNFIRTMGDTCVVALMPAPPFFPGGCLVGHRTSQIIPI